MSDKSKSKNSKIKDDSLTFVAIIENSSLLVIFNGINLEELRLSIPWMIGVIGFKMETIYIKIIIIIIIIINNEKKYDWLKGSVDVIIFLVNKIIDRNDVAVIRINSLNFILVNFRNIIFSCYIANAMNCFN